MGPMNEFIQSKFEVMSNYLERVKEFESKTSLDLSTSISSFSFFFFLNYFFKDEIQPLKEKRINFNQIEEKSILRLYSITYDLLPKIVKYIFIYGYQKKYKSNKFRF